MLRLVLLVGSAAAATAPAVSSAAAAKAAAATAASPPSAVYQCCKTSLLDKFVPAPGVTSLEACRRFCSSGARGHPVHRQAGWGCVADRLMTGCNRVPVERCADLIAAGRDGLYRLYALSFISLETTSRVGSRRVGSRGEVTSVDNDSHSSTLKLVGGLRRRVSGREGGQVTVFDTDIRSRVNGSLTVGLTSSFRGRIPTLPGAALRGVQLGTDGGLRINTSLFSTQRRRALDTRLDRVDTTTDASEQTLTFADGRRRDVRSDVGRRRTRGRDRQNTTDTASVQSRRIDTNGTATLDASQVFGAGTPTVAGQGGALRGQSIEQVISETARVTSGSGERAVDFSSGSARRTRQERGGVVTEAGRETAERGTVDQTSSSSGTARGRSERRLLERDGLGSVDVTTSQSSAESANQTDTTTRRRGTERRAQASSCPGCRADRSEDIERGSVRRDQVTASGRARRTAQRTLTAAQGGPALLQEGATTTADNSTQLRRVDIGEERRRRRGSSSAGCGADGRCRFSRSHRGSTVVTSTNSSHVDEQVTTKTKKIASATYQG